MTEPKDLLKRLNDIGRSLANTPHALALLGLGSSGLEIDRMDAYSDLDFFVLVEKGYQELFLKDLSWLSRIAPIGFHFMNTDDGYKLLFQDGIFCEFAVFEPEQLSAIPFSPGRIIWKAPGVSDKIAAPTPPKPGKESPADWLIGETLTNLYVGLGREHRGEKLSAFQFIQGYAIDRLVELSTHLVSNESSPPTAAYPDPFDNKRRYEARYPTLAQQMPRFLQGYDRNCESALAILQFLDYHYPINQFMKAAILELAISSETT